MGLDSNLQLLIQVNGKEALNMEAFNTQSECPLNPPIHT